MEWRNFIRFFSPIFIIALIISIVIGSIISTALFGFIIAFVMFWPQITKYCKLNEINITGVYIFIIDLVLSMFIYMFTIGIVGIWNPIIR